MESREVILGQFFGLPKMLGSFSVFFRCHRFSSSANRKPHRGTVVVRIWAKRSPAQKKVKRGWKVRECVR
jgi:hypothetical protein